MEPIDPQELQTVLLATDFSRWTTNAVEYAFGIARRFDAEVLMVHGIEPISDGAVEDDDDGDELGEFYGELSDKAQDRLQELVEEADRRDVNARYHIEIGQRWRIVLDCAEDEDVDLIVVGRRAQIDHENLSLGTTSQRIYFGTDRPVMTVPSDRQPDEDDDGRLDDAGAEQ